MTEIQIECFLAIANHLNFARAAEELNISQPAVTHQIQTLEAELGVKLFKRSTRSVSLTTEGMYFLDDAKSMQQIMFRAKARFSKTGITEYETLSIGCSSPSQIQLLLDVLNQMRNRYPDFHPQFRHIPQSQLPPKIDDEVIDIAFGTKININQKKNVIYRELTQMSLSCVCPINHPVSAQESISLHDIQKYKFIVYTPISASPEIAETQKKILKDKNIKDTYLCEYSEDAVLLVEAGYGITILPEIFVPDWANVITIPINDIKPLSFGAYYKRHSTNKILRDFLKLAEGCEYFADKKEKQ